MSDARSHSGVRVSSGTTKPSNPFVESRARLAEAERLRQSGKLDRARAVCEELLRRYPYYMGAFHTLGLIYADMRNYGGALNCLVRAAMMNPRDWMTLTALSGVYLHLNAPEMAAQTLEQAAKINPEDPSIFATLGEIYSAEREYELAADAFRRALALDRTLDAAQMGLGMSCLQLGEFAESAAAMEAFIKRKPRPIKFYYALTDVPPAFVKTDLLSRIEKAPRGKRQDERDYQVTYGLVRAKVLDRNGHHSEAWRDLVTTNRVIYETQQDACRAEFERQEEAFARLSRMKVKARGGRPGTGKRAISLFILGPSRSGKTTVEKLVTALDGVKRGYENPMAENAIRRAFQGAGFLTGNQYDFLPRELEGTCRDIYLEELERRAGTAKVFTNTDPSRIEDAARIAQIIPNVRFIFVKRDLDDISLRIFMKKYAGDWPFAYDLGTIRAYVTWYYRMIDELAEKLPDITLVVRYEDVIADPQAILKQAGELCGLDPAGGTLPELGDDRGCAEPYRELMAAALKESESTISGAVG